MQAYINHLLEDITAAHRSDDYFNKSRKNTEEEDFEESLRESEMFVSQEKRSGFEGYCGLKRESFPPKDQLRRAIDTSHNGFCGDDEYLEFAGGVSR